MLTATRTLKFAWKNGALPFKNAFYGALFVYKEIVVFIGSGVKKLFNRFAISH